MEIFDLHCDYLCQRQLKQSDTKFSYKRMREGHVRIQAMAIFVSRTCAKNRWAAMLEQARIFKTWCAEHAVTHLLNRKQLDVHTFKRAALLTVEGLDDVPDNLSALQQLYDVGVRSLSLTWNGANRAGDGAHAARHGGLTDWGKSVVTWCNQNNVALDASHLSERSFWDVLSMSKRPIYCSHSNVKSIVNHPRNLSDEQIKAIIQARGIIGITFVPEFLNRLNVSGINDVIKNVYHICELGGEHCVAFGSDFDGTDGSVQGIEHSGRWQHLIEKLTPYFSTANVQQFAFSNAFHYFSKTI